MFLTLKTLVYHRCKFSIPISKCSTHKFSVKINWVHMKKCTLKWEWLSLIFNALIETRQQNYRALFFDGSMVSIRKRGFLSDILRNTRFPFRGEPNSITRHRLALTSWSIGITVFFSSTCNGHWVKGSHSFCLSLMHSAHKFINHLTYGRAG